MSHLIVTLLALRCLFIHLNFLICPLNCFLVFFHLFVSSFRWFLHLLLHLFASFSKGFVVHILLCFCYIKSSQNWSKVNFRDNSSWHGSSVSFYCVLGSNTFPPPLWLEMAWKGQTLFSVLLFYVCRFGCFCKVERLLLPVFLIAHLVIVSRPRP